MHAAGGEVEVAEYTTPQPDTSLCNGFGKLEKVSPGSGGLRCSRDLAPLLPSRRYPTPQLLA